MFCSPHTLSASAGCGKTTRGGVTTQLDLFHRPQKNRGSFVPVSIGARFFSTSSRVVYPALRNVKLSSRTVPEMSFVLVGTGTGTGGPKNGGSCPPNSAREANGAPCAST